MTYRPSDLAQRMSNRSDPVDGTIREIFTLPVEAARAKAREILSEAPQGGHMTIVEQWRPLPDGLISLTIRRLRAAD
jgi:hypothetical protein